MLTIITNHKTLLGLLKKDWDVHPQRVLQCNAGQYFYPSITISSCTIHNSDWLCYISIENNVTACCEEASLSIEALDSTLVMAETVFFTLLDFNASTDTKNEYKNSYQFNWVLFSGDCKLLCLAVNIEELH